MYCTSLSNPTEPGLTAQAVSSHLVHMVFFCLCPHLILISPHLQALTSCDKCEFAQPCASYVSCLGPLFGFYSRLFIFNQFHSIQRATV